MKTRIAVIALCAMGALLLGCEKKTETAAGSAEGAPPPAASSATVASAAPSASAAPVVPDEPPTEARAERKAATEITKANYKAELAKVEKEIGQ
jgi:hypothetical protein